MMVGTFTALGGTIIPPDVNMIRTSGYYAPGDIGHASLRRMSAGEPGYGVATCFRGQSNDGAWWEVCEPLVNAFQIGAKADFYQADGITRNTPPWTDDQPVLQAALDHYKRMYIPGRPPGKTGYWLEAPLVMNDGYHLLGNSTPISDSTLDVPNVSTTLISNNGAEIINLRNNTAYHCTIQGLALRCIDHDGSGPRTTHGIDVFELRTVLRDVMIRDCNVGIGGVPGVAGRPTNLYNVHIYGCNYGVQRMRDSRWYGGRIASCVNDGVQLTQGSNDNKLDLKIDFNGGWAINANACWDLQIFSEAIDRNYRGGIRLIECQRVSGVVNLARNGPFVVNPGDGSHLYIRNTTGLALMATTASGGDDSTGANPGPINSISVEGTGNSGVLLGDWSGYLTNDVASVNAGDLRNVRMFTRGGSMARNDAVVRNLPQTSGLIANGGTVTFDFPIQPALQGRGGSASLARAQFEVRINARREDSETVTPGITIPVMIKGSGTAAGSRIVWGGLTAPFSSGELFFSTTNPGANTYVTGSITGLTFTVTLTSNFATTGLRYTVDVV